MLWTVWCLTTTTMAGYLTTRLRGPDRRIFLPGTTSHGHYQIELACSACHTPWMGVKEQSCIDCHSAELKAANDSHPKSKFDDPRNADRLRALAADKCVTCHREHIPEQTRAMGVTLPMDYCAHCHQETLKDRPSHQGFAFDTCATAGCHNYHDNAALYEDFLVKHANEPKVRKPAARPARNLRSFLAESGQRKPLPPLSAREQDAPAAVKDAPKLVAAWESTAHAKAGVNCSACHVAPDAASGSRQWTDRPGYDACATCHQDEANGFLGGRHGVRLAQKLSPMTPALARLPMKRAAAHRELTCASCHGAHEFDTRPAAVDSCLSCHDDAHSRAYKASPHFELWEAEMAGQTPPGSGVSCATCHLPREVHKNEDGIARVLVQHNQNHSLRPNEKMIRRVCLDCHSLAFAIDALADRALIRTNFAGQPSRHIESIDLALRRLAKTQTKNLNP